MCARQASTFFLEVGDLDELLATERETTEAARQNVQELEEDRAFNEELVSDRSRHFAGLRLYRAMCGSRVVASIQIKATFKPNLDA